EYRRVEASDRARRAQLSCACVGLAAEEYRLKHKRWPTIGQLVEAGFLEEASRDPFDGEPLRWRPTADGLVIYSIAPNGDYRGDGLDDNSSLPKGFRAEFRLWNPEKRSQPPEAMAEKRDD